MPSRRTFIAALTGATACLGLAFLPGAAAVAQEKAPVVFAAASLKNALDEVNAAWKAETGKSATISYAASSALAKQIESGAPADVFVSADLDWMNYLEGKKLIKAETRETLLGNDIVLIAPKDSAASTDIKDGFPLKDLLAGGKLAMGSVASVPAGKYGKAALEKLGVWDSVKGDVAEAENVRAALVLVARGEAPLGIVYKTDAASDPSVKIVGTFPADSHPPILYPVAQTADATSADGASFQTYLRSDKAKAAFEKQGFNILSSQ